MTMIVYGVDDIVESPEVFDPERATVKKLKEKKKELDGVIDEIETLITDLKDRLGEYKDLADEVESKLDEHEEEEALEEASEETI